MKRAVPLPGRLPSYLPPVKDSGGRLYQPRRSDEVLLTRPRDGNNEFAVFLGDEVLALAG
jgi:hypothetical protein